MINRKDRSHPLYGISYIQVAFHIFSVLKVNENEYWLYSRSIKEGYVHFIGKLVEKKFTIEEYVYSYMHIRHGLPQFLKTLELEFCRQMCDSKDMEKKAFIGRPPRIKDINKAKDLRKKGLSMREISRVLLKRTDSSTIYRWLKYDVSKSGEGVIHNGTK